MELQSWGRGQAEVVRREWKEREVNTVPNTGNLFLYLKVLLLSFHQSSPIFPHVPQKHLLRGFCCRCWDLKRSLGAPGWRSRLSVRLQPGHDLALPEFKPRVGLWADGSEPGACFGFCVSLSLCPSPVHALSLCLCLSASQKAINMKKMD